MSRDTHRSGEEVAKSPAAMLGEELQTAKVTITGSPMTIRFGEIGLEEMKDNAYRVVVGGEFAGAVYADESSIGESGFDLVGGAAAEVAHIWIHGKIATR